MYSKGPRQEFNATPGCLSWEGSLRGVLTACPSRVAVKSSIVQWGHHSVRCGVGGVGVNAARKAKSPSPVLLGAGTVNARCQWVQTLCRLCKTLFPPLGLAMCLQVLTCWFNFLACLWTYLILQMWPETWPVVWPWLTFLNQLCSPCSGTVGLLPAQWHPPGWPSLSKKPRSGCSPIYLLYQDPTAILCLNQRRHPCMQELLSNV